MNADQPDYPFYAWDLRWWKYLDVLGGAKRKEVPDAAAVYDRLVQYGFAAISHGSTYSRPIRSTRQSVASRRCSNAWLTS